MQNNKVTRDQTNTSPIAVNKTHTYEQEHTFIQSEEVDNEYDNKDHGKRPSVKST
jgi:hypothetical protein